MPAIRSTRTKESSSSGRASNECFQCGRILSRASDVPRHMRSHDTVTKRLPCPLDGCNFKTLQKSNLETHIRTHFLDKKFRCEDDPHCSFQCCDPASLLRHRKRFHDYIPTSRNYHKSNSPPSTRPQLSMEPVNSPIPQQQHNSPADQSPSEMCYGRELCSPVTRSTGSLDLDVVSLETDNSPPNLSDPDSTDPTLFYGQDTNSVEYWSSHFIDYNLQPHDGILTF